ncbi:hypothetical protein V5799_012362 [Amblyomma americanum]|uniref:Uncharacterized protein n=1 Tax=Amblyomma americanum TaxID=6943 RepID=A0AAQ4EE91_AMBAM
MPQVDPFTPTAATEVLVTTRATRVQSATTDTPAAIHPAPAAERVAPMWKKPYRLHTNKNAALRSKKDNSVPVESRRHHPRLRVMLIKSHYNHGWPCGAWFNA